MRENFILKGNVCYSENKDRIEVFENSYLVCKEGKSMGVFKEIPTKYREYEVRDYTDKIIIPGMTDLHLHAPQYSFRSLGMDLELLEWLETNTFPEEAKFKDLQYANRAYEIFAKDLKMCTTTRACIFATIHKEATLILMDKLEASGMVTMVGKVNMDRNSPEILKEGTEESIESTVQWLEEVGKKKYQNTYPILTPRFTPSCTDELMKELKKIQLRYGLSMQSHLSENPSEIKWVKELCPWSEVYGDAYKKFGLFGKECKTIMAHCVYSNEDEMRLMKERGVLVAHCPESNTNLSSGIAPIRKFFENGLEIGLGSDIAGGSNLNLFYAMTQAIQVSKLYWRLIDNSCKPLTLEEVFYLATKGGGKFFGEVGSFEKGYEFDAVVLDDERLEYPQELDVKSRLARIVYLSDDREIKAKYIRGRQIF